MKQHNTPDELLNLALTEDVNITSNVEGRGVVTDILYNPETKQYVTPSNYAEYGTMWGKTVDKFEYKISWKDSKLINYLTIGGAYKNQPQETTKWQISYTHNNETKVIKEGIGGWINNGIFEWKSEDLQPILADVITITIYASKSIHLRGRGAYAKGEDDSSTTPKALLVQLLPYEKEVVEETPTDTYHEEIRKLISLLEDKINVSENAYDKIKIIVIEPCEG